MIANDLRRFINGHPIVIDDDSYVPTERLAGDVVAARLNQKARGPAFRWRKPGPKPGSRRYSYDTLKVLQKVWAVSGGHCGKHLAAASWRSG